MNFFLSVFLTLAVAVMGLPSPGLTTIFTYTTNLSGPAEDPPNASPGTGFVLVTYDDVNHTIRIQATFSDLLGNTTAAHIHSPTALPFAGIAGVATQVPFFAGFPIGVTSGAYVTIRPDPNSFGIRFLLPMGDRPARKSFAEALAAEGLFVFILLSVQWRDSRFLCRCHYASFFWLPGL
jgi:hypothetical protein